MNKILTFLVVILTTNVYGQINQTIWDKLTTISTDNYELQIPHNWRILESGGKDPEQMFQADGLALPPLFNNAPVIITIFLVKQNSKDLEDCKNSCLRGYRANPDREFPEEFKDGQKKFKLTTGQNAYFLNTRFFRQSKGLNQSRFDLVFYSDKSNSGYIYTLSIQYLDNNYKFEIDNNLADFAKKLFSYLKLKS